MTFWFLIIGMALLTFAIRYSLFAWPGLRFTPWMQRALVYVPTAVLTAIVVPGMLIPDGRQLSFAWDNAYMVAGVFAIVLAAWSRHLLLTIGGSMVLFLGWRLGFGQLPW